VQLRLLPSEAPSHPSRDGGPLSPRRTIGGDLYDFLDYGPGAPQSCSAMSAAKLPRRAVCRMVSGIMRAAAASSPSRPDAGLLNDALRSASSNHSTHMLFALWNDENQTSRSRIPGGPAGLLPLRTIGHRAGRGFRLALPDVATMSSTSHQPGDVIVLCRMDLDAENEKEEMYGRSAYKACSAPVATSLPCHRDAILEDVAAFRRQRRFDDETSSCCACGSATEKGF